MNIVINDVSCSALTGQTIGKAAQLNHSHVGHLCGGRGICQTCYVTVREGSDCLSPLSDIEKAVLSERQIQSGGRLACQATIEHDGALNVLSRPEEIRRLLLSNPVALFPFVATMAGDTASRILPGIGNLAGRIIRREVRSTDEPEEMLVVAAPALQSVVVSQPEPVKLEPVVLKVSAQASEPVPVAIKESKAPAITTVTLEGIDEAHTLKLVAAGVNSLEQLLEKGREKSGRKELAVAAGIGEDAILKLVNRVDFARIRGISASTVELLEAAGVCTVFDFTQRNPSNLYVKMQVINKQKKLVSLVPSVEQMKEWINQAKKLPRLVIA
jgi:chlorosome envelope protein I